MKMKKVLHIFASLILVFSMFSSFLPTIASAVNYTGDQYVTDVQLKTPSGTIVQNGDKLNLDATYDLNYTWVIPDADNIYKNGDKLYFSIPEQFIIIDQYNFILSSGGQEVARAAILGSRETNYYIEMTFTTNYISTHSNVSGTFALKSKLNADFLKDGNNSITFPPDTIINIDVDIPKPSEPGEGGEGPPGNPGAGGGDINSKSKEGRLTDVTMKDPETGKDDRPSKLMYWSISLGRNVMLDKVDSFEDIESIIIEDRPKNQELIPFKAFNGGFGDAYGFQKSFYQIKSWDYGGINNQVMGMTKNSTGEYYDAFRMDILPRVKELEERAVTLDPDDYLRAFVVEYYTRPLDDIFLEKEYENEATITINYKNSPPDSWKISNKLLWSTGSGTITGNVASVEMTKIDTTSKSGLEGARFDLYKFSRSGEFVLYKEGIVSDADGKVTAENLTTGDYQFREVKAPDGYDLTDKVFDFEVKTEDLGTNQVIKIGEFENSSETTEISVKKNWDDNENSDGKRPATIKVQLYADGKVYNDPEILASGDGWSHTWTELPKYKDGKEVEYDVKEVGTLNDGYTSKIEKNKEGFDFYITNTRPNEKTEVSGEKTWDHGSNAVANRPTEVTVQLYADGERVSGKTLKTTASDNWKYTFKDLPKYMAGNPAPIVYTVAELDDFEDYTSISNGMDVKNTYTPGKTSLTVIKDWDHGNNPVANRPTAVNVTLYADGVATNKTATLNTTNNWRYTFDDLEIEKDGKKIEYDVKEDQVPNYEEGEHHKTGETVYINNDYMDEVVKISGTKTWNDQQNQDGKRPESIQINLFADGTQVDQLKIEGNNTANTWSYEFKGLQKYNDKGEEIKYTVTENPIGVDGYTTTQTGNNFTNSYTPEKTSIKGKKVWQDNNNQDKKRPEKLTVKLFADGVDTGKKQEIATNTNEVAYEFTNLDKYKAGELITYTVDEVEVDGYTKSIVQSDFTIYNSYTPEKTRVDGEKIWVDDDNRDGYRKDVQIDLYADDVIVAQRTATAATNWKYTFTDLPKKKDGKDIIYTVKEANKIPEYTTTVDGYNITNTHEIETVDISGEKTWTDNNNQDGKRPNEVKINLYANGNKVANTEKTIAAADGWKYEYKNLPKKEKGKDIVYSVKEDAVAGYTTKYDGYNIENIHTPEVVDVKGKKTWVDGSNQDGKRPKNDIKVELYADDVPTGQIRTISVTKDEDTYEFTNLPKYKAGKLIEYTVKEETVDEYTTTYDGLNIKNTRAPELIDIKGDKKWVDGENQDKVRPDEITVRLLADDKEVRVQKVTTENPTDEKIAWSYEFKDLPKYKDGGIEIKYTVTEDAVDKYGTTIDEFFGIVNTHKPEEVDIKGKKVWDDANNQDGKRPKDIVVELYADGISTGQTRTISTEKNEQAYEFTNLPKYKKGVEIKYTVIENTVLPDYETTYDGFTITNKYEPELIDIEGNKKWVDGENQDGIRPDHITVHLLADGQEVRVQDVTTDEPSDEKIAWEYVFKDLPKYRDHGTLIKYTVTEDAVDDYGTTIDEFFSIVNTHKPEEVDVKGEKTWDDKDNQDGKRPKEIIINLLADGEQIDERIVTEKDNWSYEFTNLPKYKKGDEIEYKIAEELIDEYSTTYEEPEDENVTNSYTPGVTARTVMKFWEDTDNQDGKRPDEIKVQLYADGEKLRDPIVLNEANDWLNTWEDLDEMKAGKTIVYTAKEIDVPGAYEVSIDDETTPGTFILVNDYTTEVLDVKGKKTWDDKNNQDGKRPKEIKVNLLADGEVIATQEVTEKDKWAYEFTDLPTYRNGEKIIYTVTEDQVDDYTTKIDGTNITNAYTPGKTSATVTKTWKDDNDKNGKRPTSISVQLYADGKAVGKKETLNKANKWTKTWSDLDEMKDGKEIVYTVKETTIIQDYEVSMNDSNIGNMILTNKYVEPNACIPNTPTPEDPTGEDPDNPTPEDPDDCIPDEPLVCEPTDEDSSGNNSSGSNSSVSNVVEEIVEDCLTTPSNITATPESLPTVDVPTIDLGAGNSGNTNEPANTSTLPKTGTSNSLWYVVAGVIILLGGWIVVRKNRKK